MNNTQSHEHAYQKKDKTTLKEYEEICKLKRNKSEKNRTRIKKPHFLSRATSSKCQKLIILCNAKCKTREMREHKNTHT